MRKIQIAAGARTTIPGFVNGNGQVVVRATGVASVSRAGQTVYRLRCSTCALEYGVAGIDVKDRLCPGCQGGAGAEPLADIVRGPGLFEEPPEIDDETAEYAEP